MVVIIGGGVVGLASAGALARRGVEVCVIERHARPGLETSTHNSGVIHAGIYYPEASLKGRLCREGRDRLYAFCLEEGVPHVRCGKLIVAPRSSATELDELARNAAANGTTVEPVDRAFVARREPHVRADLALFSPDTGWIDADAYVRALDAVVHRHDGVVLTRTDVLGIEPRDGGLVVVTPHERIDAEQVVNAAGLYADAIARMADGDTFRIHPCRGEYAELAPSARQLVKGLVYPVPPRSGESLGLHLIKTLEGSVWIGPTVRYQEDPRDYEADRLPLEAFLEPTRALLPDVRLADLRLAGSGIRARLRGPADPFADFLIRRDSRNPYVVHAAGIESPGLTASLAIGEMVARICRRV